MVEQSLVKGGVESSNLSSSAMEGLYVKSNQYYISGRIAPMVEQRFEEPLVLVRFQLRPRLYTHDIMVYNSRKNYNDFKNRLWTI